MNAHASHSDFDFEDGDTNRLVDACIARVRAEARLDDDAVLPPLPVVAPRRDVVILSKSVGERGERSRDKPTVVSLSRQSKLSKRPSRFPMMICGFIAGAAACAALLASPVGHWPAVERATQTARAQASHAAHATASFFSR